MLRPDQALYEGGTKLPVLPACEHYAGNQKLIHKALALRDELGPVFDITCDCDDGAPRGGEREHAQMIAEIASAPRDPNVRLGVRIHDPTSPFWAQDLDLVLAKPEAKIAYVCIPKVERPEDVRAVRDVMGDDRAAEIPIHVLIETPLGLRNVWRIVEEPGVEAVALGLIDFVAGHQGALPLAAAESPLQFEHQLVVRAKAELASAALAYGRVPVHGVTTDMKNVSRTRQDALRARREYGFLRQISVHPAQIEPIVAAMRPSEQELERACAILLAAQQAEWGPLNWQGRFEDRATYRVHWSLVQRARATGLSLDPALIARLFPPAASPP